ncbi:MAG: LamG domain-containing protein, partial [Planctomycetes bacterium]|nr:LamG domain-containing protein [Planctomycetota bacterium]
MVKKLAFLLCLALTVGLVGSPAFARLVEVRIITGADDMEERLEANNIDNGSSDLELAYENTNKRVPQLVALRYLVPIPKGAQIISAYVEWTVDEIKGGTAPVNLIIGGQLTPHAPAFTTATRDLSGRTERTAAKVKWAVENWTTIGQKSKTPDIASILQEIIRQDGWASGNALVLFFADDPEKPSEGVRCADAYEDGAALAPRLYIEVLIPQATNPDPADGAEDVTSPLMQWTAGDGAMFHQVYLGTKPALVAADAAGAPIPMPMYFHVAGFTPGVTYYWRVDETAGDGTVTTGKVWSFTAMHVAAHAPRPANGAVWQRNDTAVSWKAGQGAVSHTVYGGTDKAAVAAGNPSVLLGTQAATSFPLVDLKPLTVYYWRVDETDPTGKVVPGPVWSIHVAGKNTGSWRTAAETAGPGFLATYVQNGTYDIGTFGDTMTYEFVVRSNPDETQASMALIGRLNFGDTRVGLKYEQWNNTKTYGATQFGVKDHDYKVPNAPGEYTHLIFVADKAAAKTDLYVNGVLKGSIPAAILLSGQVGLGRAIRANGTFVDDFDGAIFGVAIYNRALSDAEIAANAAAFLAGGP